MGFCFAGWLTVMKENGLSKNPSNQVLVSDLFHAIREEIGSKTKSGQNAWVAKEIVSALINRKESLPKDIKNGLLHLDFPRICNALDPFYRELFAEEEIISAANEMLSLFQSSRFTTQKACVGIDRIKNNPFSLLTFLLIEAAKVENKLFGIRKTIHRKGNNILNYLYGDILSMSLTEKASNKRGIYVIPVDAGFHFHVTKSGVFPSCVSATTIHGKWINKLGTLGVGENQIETVVGSQGAGKIGDIRIFEYGESLFYLLACSKFDEMNVAHASKDDIKTALESLLQYHDSFGQGDELFVPLIGTGNSRAKLTLLESFNLIKDTVLANERWHNGTINIVLHIKATKEAEEFENVLQNQDIHRGRVD